MIGPDRRTLTLCIAALLALSTSANADKPDHAIVAGYERGLSASETDPARPALVLLGELNCTSCHKTDDAAKRHILAKSAPILDGVGSRARPKWLRSFLLDPQAIKPGTTMPNILATLPEAERKEKAEALAQFLAGTGQAAIAAADRRNVATGKTLYHEVGCVACHGVRENAPELATSIPLGDLSAKYTIPSLGAFLGDPHKARPSGRMPSLNLDGNEARAVASYLLRDAVGNNRPNVRFAVYEGEWDKLPDFDSLTAKASGVSAGFDLSRSTRPNGFAMRFEGTLRIDREEDYTFHITSDDGSRLWVDGRLVANADGIHPAQTGAGKVRLTQGLHKLVVGYFDGGGQTELSVEIEGTNLPRQSIEPFLSLGGEPPPREPGEEVFVLDPAKVEIGRGLFASLGCASCHELKRDGKAIESTLAASSFKGLHGDSGCLATTPSAKAPKFALNDAQKKSLRDAIEYLAKDPAPPSDKDAIARTLTAFNCYACHVRDGRGGVEEQRRPSFATTYADLGDEGKLPPHLDGVGAKLTRNWLDHVLNDGAKDRPYMKTRMPKFGGANVGDLAAKFVAVDPPAPHADIAIGQPEKKVKAIGRHLVGTQAFGCVQCHNFRGEASAGIPSMDMALMTRRLNRDWFARYVVDPQSYRPGTRMPSSWPEKTSQLGDILDGDSRKQIEAVWTYLLDTDSANPPYGIGRAPIPLIADKEAVLYRAFILGAGTRGIGVGYPEKVNVAFDANEGRLAMIWQGAFMDAARHWIGRGEGFQPPLGDDVVAMPAGSTVAPLKDEKAPWPKFDASGYKFGGYRLGKEARPTFLYKIGTVGVEDTPDGVVAKSGSSATIRRTVSLTGDGAGLWYRAAVGSKIEAKGDGWYTVDGEWSTRIEGANAPILRNSEGKAELLLPITFDGGKAKVVQEYRW